jgi:hypothetical protein
MSTVVGELSFQDGICRLVDDYAGIGPADYVVIAYTSDSRRHAAAIKLELDLRHIENVTFPMLPMRDAGIAARLAEILPNPSDFTGSFVAIGLELDTMSHVEEFSELISRYGAGRTKVIRVISCTDELFTSGLRLSATEIEALNATLMDWLHGESMLRVTTPSGSDLRIELDQKVFDWISNRGKHRPGAFLVLPPGEIATFPLRVDGVYRPDGAINCNVITELRTDLHDADLTLHLKESRVTHFSTSRPDVREFLDSAFALENGDRVGELGFGTNRALTSFVPHNSHLNERFPGLHLGLGQHNQTMARVPYYCPLHVDLISRDATLVRSDGSHLNLSSFMPVATVSHPVLVRDQDVTGDCCSMGCTVVSLP